MRILICGDRNWTDREKIAQQLQIIAKVHELTLHETGVEEFYCKPNMDEGFQPGWSEILVIHGAARGADRIAGEEAAKIGFEVKAFPISSEDWAHFKGGAGPIRNQLMLDEGKPDLVLAFHSNLEESKGTKDMVNRACAVQLPVEVIP
jgi:hypothetical protein